MGVGLGSIGDGLGFGRPVDAKFRLMALEDPDFEPLWDMLATD